MSYMQGRAPGPGFAPLWIGVGLALAALAILVRRPPRVARAAEAPRAAPVAGATASTLLAMTGVTVLAVAVVEPLGMIVALAILLVGLVRIFGGSWRTAGMTALILPLGLFLLFGRWLQVPLPRGPWGF
jgi:putative tricarboxylic transport membrane protein